MFDKQVETNQIAAIESLLSVNLKQDSGDDQVCEGRPISKLAGILCLDQPASYQMSQ